MQRNAEKCREMPLMEVDLDMEDMDMVNISISRIFPAKFGLVPIPEPDPKLKNHPLDPGYRKWFLLLEMEQH